MNWELELIYKNETGDRPEPLIINECFRSKGVWIVPGDSYLHILLERNAGALEIPDIDYVEWLENKVIELHD